jgi:hypothetical protein
MVTRLSGFLRNSEVRCGKRGESHADGEAREKRRRKREPLRKGGGKGRDDLEEARKGIAGIWSAVRE